MSTTNRELSHSPTHRSSSEHSSPEHSPDNTPSPSPSPERPSSPHEPTRSRGREGQEVMSSSNPLKRKAHPDEDHEEDDEGEEDVKVEENPSDEYADGRVICEHCGVGVSFRDGGEFTLKHWDAHKLTCPGAQTSIPAVSTRATRRPEGDAISFSQGPPPKRRRAKRTEAERIDYLRNDPYVSTFEPYRVLCASCDKWIRLRPNSTYCSIPWDAHRKSCLGKRINNKNVYDFDRRNETFSKDPDIRKFDPERLLCNRCDKWIPVPADEHKAALELWYAHKSTCIPRGTISSSRGAGPSRVAPPADQSPSAAPTLRRIPSPVPSTSSSPRMRQQPTASSSRTQRPSPSQSPIPRPSAFPPTSPSHPPQHASSSSHPQPSPSAGAFHDLTPTTFTPTYESRRRNAEQRAATLRADGLIVQVEPNRVFCSLCRKWVQLRQDSTYCAYPWVQHRAKCVARFQRRSEKSQLSQSRSKHASSSRSRWDSHAHHSHIDTTMPMGLEMAMYEDEPEEDELMSDDSAVGEQRRDDVELSSSSDDEAIEGSVGGDDSDDDDAESEEGVEKTDGAEGKEIEKKDKGKEKDTRGKAKEREPTNKAQSSRRRAGKPSSSAPNNPMMPPPPQSMSRGGGGGDGYLSHHRAERPGYRSIHHPHPHPGTHPYAPHHHPSSHPHPHSHSHHPHHHPGMSSSSNPYPYRTPPPGPQSSSSNPRYPPPHPHPHAQQSSSHTKSRSMPYPASNSTSHPTAHPHIASSQRRHTDSGPLAHGYRHIQAPPPPPPSHPVQSSSRSRAHHHSYPHAAHHGHPSHPSYSPHPHGHAHPHAHHSHPISHSHSHPHSHPHSSHQTHRPTLETDGLVEVKPNIKEDAAREAEAAGITGAPQGGVTEVGDVEGDADADGEPDAEGEVEDEAAASSTGAAGGNATAAGGAGITNGVTPIDHRTRSSGSTRPGSSNGESNRRRRGFDLDSPMGRIQFIAHSISHLFTTTYAPTDELSIASLVAYVNAALPPDRYEDFDTREVSRAAVGLRERGEIWYEVDIIRLVSRD